MKRISKASCRRMGLLFGNIAYIATEKVDRRPHARHRYDRKYGAPGCVK